MNWIILIVAGLFETGFAFCLGKMKEATGAEYCWWGAGFLLSLALSMTLLAKATQSLPIGTAYPVWTGIGAVGTVLAGILFLNEPATFPHIASHRHLGCKLFCKFFQICARIQLFCRNVNTDCFHRSCPNCHLQFISITVSSNRQYRKIRLGITV